MKAEKTNIYSKNRVQLHEVVPLDTPFSIIIEPTTFCNLKCKFCLHSFTRDDMVNSGHVFQKMSGEIFQKVVDQIKMFPQSIKSINFAGVGEPLLHEDLTKMIRQLKNTGRVITISIISNGLNLSKSLSDDLVNSGVDSLKISLNGLTDESYYDNCGVRLDFNKFYAEIRYLYENKKNMKLGIKILDSCLRRNEEVLFYEMFGDYCDEISIEKTVPLYDELSYENLITDCSLSRYELTRKIRICPSPFFRISVRSTGIIMLCCPYNGLELDGMNVNQNCLIDCWNSEMHRTILHNILAEKYEGLTNKCKKCALKNDFAFSEDILDDYVSEIWDRVRVLP